MTGQCFDTVNANLTGVNNNELTPERDREKVESRCFSYKHQSVCKNTNQT